VQRLPAGSNQTIYPAFPAVNAPFVTDPRKEHRRLFFRVSDAQAKGAELPPFDASPRPSERVHLVIETFAETVFFNLDVAADLEVHPESLCRAEATGQPERRVREK
jgi:hypothetical protein